MKNQISNASRLVLLASLLGLAVSVNAADGSNNAAWTDGSGNIWRDAGDNCWRDPGTTSDMDACAPETDDMSDDMSGEMEMADSDGDGVNDANDRCLDTPTGVGVDQYGCAIDSDNDGVPNYRDYCPGTPAGADVDDLGCQKVLEETVKQEIDILFGFDKAEVREQYYGDIRELASFMKKYASTETEIAGHTDSVGPKVYNKELSQRRANAVVDVLVNEFGISRSRLDPVGFGESLPVATNDTKKGRQQNRRVVATVTATERRTR